MKGNLVSEAICMENAAIVWVTVAVKSNHSLTLPNAVEANSTVEILAFFEEKTSKRPASNSSCNPHVLARVCLTRFDAIADEAHKDKVHSNETHVKMEN